MNKTKILLIRPQTKYPHKHKLGILPLGLLYLSAYIKRETNSKTKIIDFHNKKTTLDMLVDTIKNFTPKYIGISASSMEYNHAQKLAKIAKKVTPKTPLIIGGPHVTANKEKVFTNTLFEYGILGEGEQSFHQLITALENKKPVTSIDGLIYFDKNRHLKINDKQQYIENLDSLPMPDWDAIEIKDYGETMQKASPQDAVSLVSSRGCPYKCAFCHNINGKNTRFHSAERIFKEISTLYYKYNIKHFEFVDDIFNLDKKRMKKICNLIIKSNLKISLYFGNGLRGDLLDEEQILLLKKAGTKVLTFAVEFGSERMQKKLKKNINLKKIQKNITIASKNNICCSGYFMMNGPGETLEEMKQTANFLLKSKLDYFFLFFLCPYPNTDVYKMITPQQQKEFINLAPNNDYLTTDFYNISNANKKEILKLYKRTFVLFYLNPFRLFHLLITYPSKIKLIKILSNTKNSVMVQRIFELILRKK